MQNRNRKRQAVKLTVIFLTAAVLFALATLLLIRFAQGSIPDIHISCVKGICIAGSFLVCVTIFSWLTIFALKKRADKISDQMNYIDGLMNSVPAAIALLEMTPPYRVLRVNSEGMRLMGFAGKSDKVIVGKSAATVIADRGHAYAEEILQRSARTDEKLSFENCLIRSDGTEYWAGGIVKKICGESGQDILITAFRDITEEKKAAQRSKQKHNNERNMLAAAVSAAYPVIASVDIYGDRISFVYLQTNYDSQAFGETKYTAAYEKLLSCVTEDMQSKFVQHFAPENLQKAFESGRTSVLMEMRAKLSDGQFHWISVQMIHSGEKSTDSAQAACLIRRIDKQRIEEEERRRSMQTALDNAQAENRAKMRFLADMSHDIRTPMNAIIGLTGILSKHCEDNGELTDCLAKLTASSQHMMSLINNVLDMTEIEQGRIILHNKRFSYSKLVSEAASIIRPQADSAGISLRVNVDIPEHDEVTGDPLRIRQVFLNILSNAVKYTARGGSVEISAELTEVLGSDMRNCQFRCADTGVGMNEEMLNRLYKPFERASDSSSGCIEGAGLGMSIVKNFLDLMGGSIAVSSKPGKGTVFVVIIPLHAAENDDKKSGDVHRKLPDLSGKRILVAEDNDVNRMIASVLLTRTGAFVDEAADGQEALDMFSRSKEGYYDLIVLDVRMPVIDGLETARRIRGLRRSDSASVLIAALSANSYESDKQESLKAGMNVHLAKPIEPDVLYSVLDEYFHKEEAKSAAE